MKYKIIETKDEDNNKHDKSKIIFAEFIYSDPSNAPFNSSIIIETPIKIKDKNKRNARIKKAIVEIHLSAWTTDRKDTIYTVDYCKLTDYKLEFFDKDYNE